MIQANKLSCGEVVAIDGKTVRSSFNPGDKKSAIHMVSAFAIAISNGVVVGQIKTEEKSNLITAIPALLKVLDIRGCLITIDAICCQKIADTIVNRGTDYLLALKTNQELLHRAAMSAFYEVNLTAETQIENGHGRIETREYYVLDATDIAGAFPQWKNLQTIGMAINYQNDGEKESVYYRYYISSAELTAEQLGKAVRGHWG